MSALEATLRCSARPSLRQTVRASNALEQRRRVTPLLAALIAASLTAVGCSADAGSEEPVLVGIEGDAHPNVYGGTRDDDDQANQGVVALRVGTGGTFELCSGALVARNLVLTARHCVTKNVTTSVSCDENGRSANGKHISADEDPTTIGIYTSPTPNFAQKPEAMARAIIGPKGPYLCDSDIALVVLEHDVQDVTPLPVRLASPSRLGEEIRAVGYGQNDQDTPIGTRFRKLGLKVLAQGKGLSPSKTPLGEHEFEVGRSICQGDSGGPAISEETRAVIGVVSRGGSCEDDFGHIYTTTAGFDSLFDEAFAIAGTTPTLEVADASGSGSTRSRSAGNGGAGATDSDMGSGACSISGTGRSGSSFGPTAALLALAVSLVLRSRSGRRRSE